ncbi:MAG TPA: alpha-L-rhamnosidase C-terminal domain-containing protein [Puia sp.]
MIVFLRPVLFLIFFQISISGSSQSKSGSVLNESWKASWIAVPGETTTGYGVYLFRKSVNLTVKPDSFIIHISADNRYKLFINEQQVSLGPARGDLDHWNFETLDVAPFLHIGVNIFASEVWNEGEWRAEGQISLRTGFIMQADNENGKDVNTGKDWKCIRDQAYSPLPFKINAYYVAGPGEIVNFNILINGWKKSAFDDSHWQNAESFMEGMPENIKGGYGTIPGWLLKPSDIPAMELKSQRFAKLISADGVKISDGFPSIKTAVTIPAHTNAILLLDQGFLTNAYPEIIFSGGKSGTVSLSYAEALFTHYPSKGNRDETRGKIFIGRKDSLLSNGNAEQIFTTLTFRTYRFLQVQVHTQEDPLTIDDLNGTATGYPFQFNANLSSDNPELNRMLDIGWRTARLCAMETYMDCPYYEQLQYIGDARIQALISLFNSGDERLLRNAMNEMDNSRRPEGVTLSRHPSQTPQYIPTFSFWYIGMLHDYMMYGRDSSFIINKLSGERQILQYFKNYQQPDGSLKGVPYWMFTDWVETNGWKSGVGPIGKDGSSSLLDLQLLWAYQLAADLESRYGMSSMASMYIKQADQLKKTIINKYWDNSRNMFSDVPEKNIYSQHANILAILTGSVDQKNESALAKLMLSDTGLAQASIYFKYYLHIALIKAGLGNDYLNWLGLWRDNIKMGMTTWAEIPDINNARSDCHAWGASPNIEFFRTILGIDSKAPGFARVKIEPHLGALKHIEGEIPHPNGKIKAGYHLESGQWQIKIDLPDYTEGEFIWQGKTYLLNKGENKFKFKS